MPKMRFPPGRRLGLASLSVMMMMMMMPKQPSQSRGRGAILLGGLLLYVCLVCQPLRKKHFVLEQIAGFTQFGSMITGILVRYFSYSAPEYTYIRYVPYILYGDVIRVC